MKTKQEIKQWLLDNCVDEYGDLDLSDLDFSDFNGNVSILGMKVKHNLHQNAQEVGGYLVQSRQIVGRDLYQSNQKVANNLFQNAQEVGGNLIQTALKVKGTIHQNALTKDEIDEQINMLKKVISALEEQQN